MEAIPEYNCVLTTCPYCGCGCQYYLQVLDGELIGVTPCKTHPISQGKLCIKGWNSWQYVVDQGRLTKPLIKKDGKFVEASWDEALDLVAKKLKELKEKYGPDALGYLSSAKTTNEENYVMMKFARAVMGTNNVDHCARLCHASTVAGLAATFGSGAMTNSIPEIEYANVILITGSNTIEQHPLMGKRILAAKEKGAKIILVDPRAIQLSNFADMHLRQRPGTDVAWINGMMNVIIGEGLYDKEFVENFTEGFEELKKLVAEYTPEKVEKISGIPKEQLVEAARLYASGDASSIVYSMGITQHTTGTDNVKSCANLAMVTGNMGKPSTGVNPLRGQNNVQGACDLGALPVVYSGYQKVIDEAARKKFEEAWNTPNLPPENGITVVEMMNAAADGKIKGIYIMGENPMLSNPDINHVRKGLENLEFLVVQDIFLTETAELADVVLPGATYAEKDGTFTATDRQVQRVRKAIEPIGESRADWEIITDLANRMGRGDIFPYKSAKDIMDEINRVTPSYAGITYDRLDKLGRLPWPCPAEDHPGTVYLHKDGKFTRGKGLFFAVPFLEPAELPDDDYPLIMTTGRVMFHFHTGTMTRKSRELNREVPTGFVEINPADAEARKISDKDMVKVSTRRGEIEIPAMVTERVPEGIIFIPFHFKECAANVLTNPALDPVAKIPEFKVCAAQVKA